MSANLQTLPEQGTIDELKTPTGVKIKTKDDFLRFVRTRRDYVQKTQAQIAKALEYSSGEYWALIESGKRNIDQEKVPRWAEVLQLEKEPFTRLFLKVFSPNVYFTLWGKEELDLQEAGSNKSFVRIDEQGIDILNSLNRLPARHRKTFTTMLHQFLENADK